MKKILVTTDASKNAVKALMEAKKLAECTGASIDIMHVVKNPIRRPYIGVNEESLKTMKDLEKLGKEILDDAAKLFNDFQGEVNYKLRSGNPADVIIEEAKDSEYDLIVMGSRGLGTFSRTMLGSVSNKVLSHSDVDVLIIK